MKKKELKNLAKKIAQCEYVIANSKNESDIEIAREEIMRLSSKIHDFQDLDLIDELVQELLKDMS